MPEVTPVAGGHIHKFEIVKDIGTCACGEKRRYIIEGRESRFEVLQKGDINYRDNSKLRTDPPAAVKQPLQEVPPKPRKRDEFAQYWEDNKAAIITDLKQLGPTKMTFKWGIGGATWINLKKKWNILNIYRKHLRSKFQEKANESQHKSGDRSFEGFPSFQEDWSDPVKIAWFNAYVELKKINKE